MFTKHGSVMCFLIVAVALLAQTLSAFAAVTIAGTYRNWNGEIDEVTIVQPFRAALYNQIAVEPLDTAGVTLPDRNDNTYPAVQSALRMIKPAFMKGLEKKLRRKAGTNVGRDTLVIRARLTKVDPGSQAARYWAGFGAGAVKIAMTGEIIDASSQKTLVRFKQERRSAIGWFGGGYGDLFARTARQIGGDIASLVNAF